jgi:hypothetical protein
MIQSSESVFKFFIFTIFRLKVDSNLIISHDVEYGWTLSAYQQKMLDMNKQTRLNS